jgi:hypothetical protein
MKQGRSVFLVLTRFKGPQFLEALRKGGATGDLEVTSVLEEVSQGFNDDVVIALACSADSLQDAVELAATYANDRYPKSPPDCVAVVMAPDAYLNALSKSDRVAFENASGVKEQWDGPIVIGPGNGDYAAVSDLAFDLGELQWTEFASGTFAKKHAAHEWRDE